MRTVYLDGQFVPEAQAKLSIYDLSVMQACAAFEMTRSFCGEHFKLDEHLIRLIRSCELLSIPLPDELRVKPYGHRTILEIIHDLTRQNAHGPGEEHRLLIVVSPGCAPMYKELEGVIPHPFLYLADFPLRYTVQGFGTYFTEGVHCSTSNIQQVPDASVPSQAKHRSRLHFHLAQQQAPPGTWPLLCAEESGPFGEGTEEIVTEAPGANLVYVDHQDTIYTVEHNALHGISMQTVKHLTGATAERCGISPKTLQHPKWIKELWLTGTPFCLLPVVSLDGKPIGDGTVGPVYRETLAKWNALVGLDIAQQIQDWDTFGPGPTDPGQYQRWAADKDFLRGKVWTPDAQRLSPAQHRVK